MSNWNSPPAPTLFCPNCGCADNRVEATKVGGFCACCGRIFALPKRA